MNFNDYAQYKTLKQFHEKVPSNNWETQKQKLHIKTVFKVQHNRRSTILKEINEKADRFEFYALQRDAE